jgi:serine/threonine-protein kinase
VRGERDRAQLVREVQLVAQLRHPTIMPVKHADFVEGHAILATELSVGTLADRSRPMSVRRILAIVLQVLEGLAYAHRQRIVHCDVTPANIFLFPDGRAALGDFGISVRFHRHMATLEDFGTPGYVAPEQAYGKPSYQSDCFAVALILYEYLTGTLPRWPFRWPTHGYERLRDRVSGAMVALLRRALSVDPQKRFADAGEMLVALRQVVPKGVRTHRGREVERQRIDWRTVRRAAFVRRYEKVLRSPFRCVACGEPIAESMSACPWCGSEENLFDTSTEFSHVCPRCRRGVLPEWRFCPWCYGAGFASPSQSRTPGIRYQGRCRHCRGQLMRFMRFCPWCRRKVRRPWQAHPFPETCGRCAWSVDSQFWTFCPWCRLCLVL